MASSLAGILSSSSTRWRDSASEMVPRTWPSLSASRKSAVSWAVKALVEATPISGPALVVMVPWASREMAAPTTLQMARVLRAGGDELALGGEGVGGFAGLGDEQADGAGSAMGSR